MDRLTLRSNACVRRVPRYDEEELPRLVDFPLAGPTPMLSATQMSQLTAIIEAGPDPERDGTVRWQRIDLYNLFERRFGISVAERTMS